MAGPFALRDYQRLLDLAVSVLESDAAALPWTQVRPALRQLLGCTAAVLFYTDGWFLRPPGGHPPPLLGDLLPMDFDAAMHRHPLVGHYERVRSAAPPTVHTLSAGSPWEDQEAREIFQATFRAEQQLAIPLPAPPGQAHLIMMGRDGGPFDARGREQAAAVQPVLQALVRHFHQLRRAYAAAPDVAAVEAILTPREAAVLVLLAESRTAEAIGRRLGISPRTAHKHIENLYRKLGTHDRLETVLRAQLLGLLPDISRPSANGRDDVPEAGSCPHGS
ncbi:response regulator transcription factor [Embleya sp. AB8]|uniref:helix-turn-helix transcriptional regulator n=1 Tax=Embleya sp. AB8 TaxID=3156304 RepID=UPI003C76F4D7